MPPFPAETFPERLTAICTPEQAHQLIDFDHHTVRVDGRLGVMITYPRMEALVLGEELPEAPELIIIFRNPEMHPPAPAHIQQIIDQLEFHSPEGNP